MQKNIAQIRVQKRRPIASQKNNAGSAPSAVL